MTFGPLRKHQAEGVTIARRIARGVYPRRVVTAAVTPGGGKSLLASVFAHVLLGAGRVDAVCILCPRDSLRHQMQESFTVPERGLRRHLLANANRYLPQTSLFGEVGYSSTYQAVASAAHLHHARFARERFLLVLDEPHHLSDSGHAAWVAAVRPLAESAAVVLAMSGTLYRHDRKSIPFVTYNTDGTPIADIRYSRRDALAEHAILPVEVTLFDGRAEYEFSRRRHVVNLANAAGDEEGRALRTLLWDPHYRETVIRRSLGAWEDYRHAVYESRALIVCHDQETARHAANLVAREFTSEVALAISDEPGALRTLREFRAGRGQVLVTVGMATEGFDAVDITHLVCLTDVRSTPWLDQCFARATRVNPHCGVSWERQRAYLYVPDDPAMATYLNAALEEQDEYIDERSDSERGRRDDNGAEVPGVQRCALLAGVATGERFGDTEGVLGDAENDLVARVRDAFPELQHIDARVVARIGQALALPRVQAS